MEKQLSEPWGHSPASADFHNSGPSLEGKPQASAEVGPHAGFSGVL